MTNFSHCIKCSAPKGEGSECPKCGVIYEKAEAVYLRQQADNETEETEPDEPTVEENQEKEEIEITQPNDRLIDCPACDRSISKNAQSCPHCGEPLKVEDPIQSPPPPPPPPPQKQKTGGCGSGCLVVFGAILLLGFISSFFDDDQAPPPKKTTSSPQTKAPLTRQGKIEKCFSGWDGSHRELTKVIKKSMNDPDSYEHDETRFSDKGDHLLVITSFRGKNAFGGVVKDAVIAKTDIDTCTVIEIVKD